MFSVVSVCSRGHVTITHDALEIAVQELMPDMFKLVQLLGPHCTGPLTPPLHQPQALYRDRPAWPRPPPSADIWQILNHVWLRAGATHPTGMRSRFHWLY